MSKKNIKTLTAALLAIIPIFFGSKYFKTVGNDPDLQVQHHIGELYKNRQSGVMIEFEGLIIKVLSDDLEGSRHQRFIVRVNKNQTVLIAHNIDVAPRVPIERNKKIMIYGQYEWNDKGGVVHWTHHDPDDDHEHGWIRFQGKKYQ